MRIRKVKTKNTTQYAIIYDVTLNGKRTTKIYQNLGTLEKIKLLSKNEDPLVWLNKYVDELNEKIKEDNLPIFIKKVPNLLIPKGEQNIFNCGYLFLEKIYYELGINKICESISNKYKFEYDFNNILSRLIYGRVLYPCSKLATHEISQKFIEQPNFKLHDIYRALEVISKENEYIQSELYKNSLKISKRNTGILYYDCTNYFFEIEQEEGLKQYGPSKEHKPNPIVQMGLFMDGDGIPLAFNITSGNTNEQTTLTPLEEKILEDFKLSKFIVCTDAGLASNTNRKFNNKGERAFITTQSIKKLKKHLMEWALDENEWKLKNEIKTYTLKEINENEEKYRDKIFYKDRWIKENGLEQKLIVTYSIKYRNYQKQIRNSQIERAKKAIETNNIRLNKSNQNDYKRFVSKTNITKDGEIAENKIFSLNTKQIEKEEKFDGFYGVCTNLEDEAEEIIKVNQRRWEIEECFRIIKSEFKARPVYLQRDDRITAHFTTCFLSLVLYRYLEKRIEEKYTCTEIIETIRNMNLNKISEIGYIPAYTRTEITDILHDKFNFRTDNEITKNNKMKKILKNIKL